MKKRIASPELSPFRDAADVIGNRVESIAASLDRIHDEVLSLMQSVDGGLSQLTRGDLGGLHPVIRRTLEQHAGLLVGAGFVAEMDVLADARQWLEWLLVKEGTFIQMQVTLDVNDVANYDYQRSDWFDLPKRGQDRAVVGPYVDFGGTNEYVVTITKPVRSEDRFLGIIGADLSVDRVEGLLRRLARNTVGLGAIVITTDGRVIASSVPGMFPGTLLAGLDVQVAEGDARSKGLHVLAIAGIPWRLVVLSCEDPRACDRDCRSCIGLVGPGRMSR